LQSQARTRPSPSPPTDQFTPVREQPKGKPEADISDGSNAVWPYEKVGLPIGVG
jgi:hypothetical protein